MRGPFAARAVLAALVVGLLSGCTEGPGAAPPRPADAGGDVQITDITLEHDGTDRTFRITAPAASGDDPLPVLVALHGAGGSAVTLSYLTGFDLAVPESEFLLVEPDGTGPDSGSRTWNAGTCCGSSIGTVDDVGFLAAMLDRVADDFAVDVDRVYLAGFSNGGMLAYRAACELGEQVAGIAVVAGTMNVEDCPAPAPVPVLAIHGSDDSIVPLDGGVTAYSDPRVEPWDNLPVDEAVGFWAERDGCSPDAVETVEGAARVRTWDGCDVELWIVDGGRHTWFGGPMAGAAGLEPDGAPSATNLILDFFGLTESARAS